MRFNLSVEYNIELPQNKAKTSTAATSKAEASSSFKGFGFFKTLNTTWFNKIHPNLHDEGSRVVWLTNVDQHGLPVDSRKERTKMELPYFTRRRSRTAEGVYPLSKVVPDKGFVRSTYKLNMLPKG